MVVLAASVLTKTGKVLLSRQFVDIARVRIEGLLAAFPKLVGSDVEHTYIETDSVRYLYQPIENLYVVLITNKNSNILEDLDTLHLFAKIVPEQSKILEEEEILKHSFEIVIAFDEVITLGYKEKVTLQQIKIFLEMDSHEEKIHEMIEKNKQREAREEAKRRQHQIERDHRDNKKPGSSSGFGGFGGSVGGGTLPPEYSAGINNSGGKESFAVKDSERSSTSSGPKKGMVLGKTKKGDDFLKALAKDDQSIAVPTSVSATPVQKITTASEPVTITIEEKIAITCLSDGGLQDMEIKGDMSILINNPDFGRVVVQLAPDNGKSFQYKTHPNVNKNNFGNDNSICLKDPSRPFPAGNALGVLKWRYQTKDESQLPLSVNCWPTPEGDGTTTVNIEYELLSKTMTFHNVVIIIPLPGTNSTVINCDGSYKFDLKHTQLQWEIPVIDSASNTGSMEFTIKYTGDNSSFFPINVNFQSSKTYLPMKVLGISSIDDNTPVRFSLEQSLNVEKFEIISG